jgi:hypothetical protein
MTDWAQVREDGYPVPGDRSVDELVAELTGMLRSPDPVARDRQAYSVLATWIGRGVLSAQQLRALGDPSVRFGALLAGTVDATMITIGNARIAQAKGFRILAYSGDYVSALSANLETSDDKIQSAADEVYKVVKATLKGQIFYHRNANESTKCVMEVLRISDIKEAKEIWQERDKQASELAKIGRASEEVMQTNIDRVQAQMKSVGEAMATALS